MGRQVLIKKKEEETPLCTKEKKSWSGYPKVFLHKIKKKNSNKELSQQNKDERSTITINNSVKKVLTASRYSKDSPIIMSSSPTAF